MLERRDGTISVNYPRILRYYSPEPEPGSRCNNTRPEPSSTWADISGAWAACGEEMARDVSWWTAENWVVTICMNQRGGGFLARAEANYHRDVIWVQTIIWLLSSFRWPWGRGQTNGHWPRMARLRPGCEPWELTREMTADVNLCDHNHQ